MTGQRIGTVARFIDQIERCEFWVRQIGQRGEEIGVIQRLRKALDEDLAAIVVTASRLQRKAVAKLGSPPVRDDGSDGVWWVTDKSLQQATPWQVAQHKANWMHDGPIADVCCGIGGDSIALARHGSLTAIERDELAAAMARANLCQLFGDDRISVLCRDASEISLPRSTQIHIDPDRRADSRRRTSPDHYSPSWQEVLSIVAESPAIIKLAPLAKLDSMTLPTRHHRCWISLQRTVREQSLLCGECAVDHDSESTQRSAVAISADATARTFTCEFSYEPADSSSNPLAALIDPDPAIRAAELTEAFARRYDLALIGGPSGFLTTAHVDQVPESAHQMAIVSSVVWSGPCDMKKIRRELRSRNARATTAKVRGTDHDPAKILKPLSKTGEHPLVLWIGRTGDGVYAALTE